MDCGRMIGVVAAMPEESALLARAMQDASTYEKAGLSFVTGKLFERDVTVVTSGIGKVNAALCTQMLIDCYGASPIINVGVAGALSSTLKVGDVVVARDAVQYDVDVTPDGYEMGEVPNMDRLAFAADTTIAEKAMAVADALGYTAQLGRVLTADRVVYDSGLKAALAAHFDGICCEMEGAAIGQVATVNGVPFAIVRVISDLADGDLKATFAANYEAAVAKASAMTLGLIHLL